MNALNMECLLNIPQQENCRESRVKECFQLNIYITAYEKVNAIENH